MGMATGGTRKQRRHMCGCAASWCHIMDCMTRGHSKNLQHMADMALNMRQQGKHVSVGSAAP